MVTGLGVDIVQTSRFDGMSENAIRHILSIKEQSELEGLKSEQARLEFLSSRFAAKEAFVKALGEGFRTFHPREITITHDELGTPHIEIPLDKRDAVRDKTIFLSISHEKDYSVAVVVLDGKV